MTDDDKFIANLEMIDVESPIWNRQCSCIMFNPWPKTLSPHLIDKLLCIGWGDVRDRVFTTFDSLLPHQIEKGLADKSPIVRRMAYTHPSCTNAQKVKFCILHQNSCEINFDDV